MSEQPVLVERSESVIEIVLNRPERKNAITGPLAVALRDAVLEASADATAGAILLRGSGAAFCSGLDLKEFNADPRPDWAAGFQESWLAAHAALFDCPKVIVGALERYAINGGGALALACDLLVAGKGAYLQVGEIQQGIGAPMNLAWLAVRHSEAVAARLALTGERVAGDELVRLGVAYSCVEDDSVVSEARALAARLATFPPSGAATIKRTFRTLHPGVGGGEWFAKAAAASGRRSGSGGLQAAR